uniref:THAP domain-containing protein 8 n=1 Tax=Camelus bactrianus TaxID=9837 RepID=A0A9W3EIE0_CAMBA|nr:THAP domain-containing protein 8 [Camelus bactrianus]
MPKYCRAPNCSNTAGQLGADNRPVSFYKFPLKDGPRLQAWLRHMGREHWVPSCHQHLCSEHFAPSCFQWRWGVRYLRPDAVPSIFSRAPPAKRQQNARSAEKPVLPAPPQEATSKPAGARAPGPAVRDEKTKAQSGPVICPKSVSGRAGIQTLVSGSRGGLCFSLGALPAWQHPGPEESEAFTIICGGPDIAVVLAQGPAPPTLDTKLELLDTQTPSV